MTYTATYALPQRRRLWPRLWPRSTAGFFTRERDPRLDALRRAIREEMSPHTMRDIGLIDGFPRPTRHPRRDRFLVNDIDPR